MGRRAALQQRKDLIQLAVQASADLEHEEDSGPAKRSKRKAAGDAKDGE